MGKKAAGFARESRVLSSPFGERDDVAGLPPKDGSEGTHLPRPHGEQSIFARKRMSIGHDEDFF